MYPYSSLSAMYPSHHRYIHPCEPSIILTTDIFIPVNNISFFLTPDIFIPVSPNIFIPVSYVFFSPQKYSSLSTMYPSHYIHPCQPCILIIPGMFITILLTWEVFIPGPFQPCILLTPDISSLSATLIHIYFHLLLFQGPAFFISIHIYCIQRWVRVLEMCCVPRARIP